MAWKSLAFTDLQAAEIRSNPKKPIGPSEQSFCKKCSQNRRNLKESQGAGR